MYDSIVERMLKRPGAAMIVYGIITAVAGYLVYALADNLYTRRG